ncbi:hypothetical protein H6P81_021467 [Aristolochia fimbriata]|uniref:Uncharacterized protein n=1 Tax=Aristolochia fimbriata TaxID=158543 RepID=A0AAV7DRG8_ARIFI|nr:hypothetical protein H6P81_021467 [Aristolochia fimbriata]
MGLKAGGWSREDELAERHASCRTTVHSKAKEHQRNHSMVKLARQSKAICPSLPLGDGLQLFASAGKGPSGQRDPFAQLRVFLIFHALCGTVRCPSPDLDLHVRRLWRFADRHARGGHRASRTAAASRVVHVGHALSGASGHYEPSSRQRHLPFTHRGPPAALLGRWHSPGACVFFPERAASPLMYSPFETRRPDPWSAGTGGRNRRPRFSFPSGLVSRRCVLERRTPKVFMDPCECGSPDGLGWIRKRSLIAQLLLDRRCPRPVLRRFARALRVGVAVSRGCYLVDPASSHMLVSKIKPCMCKYEQIQTVKPRMAH